MGELNHKERIALLKAVIKVVEENRGIQRPGFGQKEFGLILSHNKYKMPEKKVTTPALENSPLLQQKGRDRSDSMGMDLKFQNK